MAKATKKNLNAVSEKYYHVKFNKLSCWIQKERVKSVVESAGQELIDGLIRK